ncbi:MAG: cysteine synthase A [Butyrivibrio sp.]|nr:cysteine synthase A [Butyrivibrio sp.]
MPAVYHGIEEMVGNTPLLEMINIEKKEKTYGRLFAKIEANNPGGSVKDRIALNMIRGFEERGELKPGGTIIESTSGNTGIGLAAIAAAKGYKVIIVMPENMSKERVHMLKAYGAEVVLSPAELYMNGANQIAEEIYKKTDNAVMTQQRSNPDNPAMHFKTTGPEIWSALDGKVDAFITAVGTGGTLTGTSHFLKEKNPDIFIGVVEPAKANIFSGGTWCQHKIQGIGPVEPPEVLDTSVFQEVFDITDEEAYETARMCPRVEGMTIGFSGGAILTAAIRVAKRKEFENKNIVFVFPDRGERYLSSGIYDY